MEFRNGHLKNFAEMNSLPANFDVKQAILEDTDLTKDLEEQISNVEIAEHITSRPSFDSSISSPGKDSHKPSVSKSSKMVSNIAPVARASRMIEPISESILPVSNRIAQNIGPLRKNLQRCETTVVSSNRNSGLGRYHSLLGDVDLVKKTRGSLTSSDEEDKGESGKVDPVSFSATGATILCSATQTPEDMNSSDSEYTDEETEKVDQPAPVRETSSESSGDSTSETEEWDSEADTHTSSEDENDPEQQPKPSYYQVIDPVVVRAEKSHTPQRMQNGRSLREQYVASLPWIRRPAFSSMQFPSVNANNHPRRAGLNAIPSSRSFPQEFFQMVSNPFFNTSLHEAYRQACAFKDWYEAHFPEHARHGFAEETLVNGQALPPTHAAKVNGSVASKDAQRIQNNATIKRYSQ